MEKSGRYGGRSFKRKEIIYTAIAICFVLGTISGAIKANLLNGDTFENISANLTVYINNLSALNFNKSQIFAECLVKYGKTLLIIWFLAFIPPTAFISLLLIFAKGMSLGFTTGLLVLKFGFSGSFYACVLYLPQNLVLIWAYFFAAHHSLTIAMDYIRGFQSGKKFERKVHNAPSLGLDLSRITENGVSVLVGIACVVLAGVIETFVIPWLAGIFIG